jgi:ectoine hydroxylase-related dioxygenase (phytanoyl-CoA dioxygenase family)
LQWDLATIPWLDRYYAEIDAYIDALPALPEGYDLREKLLVWAQFGYVKFEGVVEPELIDAYLADVDEFLATRERYGRLLNIAGKGETPAREVTDEDLQNPHIRIMDFHNTSLVGKQLMLHPAIVSFLEHVFHDRIVAMQSLTFPQGTEQPTHQDFAFVVSQIPSHLAAAWIALEDVHPDAGPLGYYPGSHTIRKFDWGNGLYLTPESAEGEGAFAAHIEEQSRARGIGQEIVLANKGDVFLWHAALAHLGTPVNDPARTRKSYVVHYSSQTGYPRDRRAPDAEPVRHEHAGGLVYADPQRPDEENALTARQVALPPTPQRDPSIYARAIRRIREQEGGVQRPPAPAPAAENGSSDTERLRAELEHVRNQLHTVQNSKLMRATEPAREAWYRLRKRGD